MLQVPVAGAGELGKNVALYQPLDSRAGVVGLEACRATLSGRARLRLETIVPPGVSSAPR